MSKCKDCITMAKCCERFHANGDCCNEGKMILVPCPVHAIVGALAQHMTTAKREAEAEESEDYRCRKTPDMFGDAA